MSLQPDEMALRAGWNRFEARIGHILEIPGVKNAIKEASTLFDVKSSMQSSPKMQLLQPLWWCCVDCVIHPERDVREEQHHTYTVCGANKQ